MQSQAEQLLDNILGTIAAVSTSVSDFLSAINADFPSAYAQGCLINKLEKLVYVLNFFRPDFACHPHSFMFQVL